MKSSGINEISAKTLIGLCLVMITAGLINPPGNILSWDVFGHYLYLPALFIYDDLGLKDRGFVDNILATYQNSSTFYQVVLSPTGNILIKYSSGLAILYLPFFFLGHLTALIAGFPADGFSAPYQYSIFAGCLIYSMSGLFFLRKVLRKFYPDKTTALVLILLFLGTNYFSESVYKGAMAHNLLFTLYAINLWLTIKWHESYRLKYAVMLGLVLGLTSMSRPTDIVSVFIPALWGIYNVKSLKNKILLLWRYKFHVLLLGLGFLAAWAPQLIYWKKYAGQFFYYSYDNPGEGLELLRPYTLQVLLSFRKGWLVYTPLMIFAIIGFITLYRKQKQVFAAVIVYFIFNLYLVSSWSCWWYAESFGHRAMVQSYPVMALALGSLVLCLSERSKWLRIISVLTAVLLIVLNLFQTWQLNHGILHGSRMTKEYYLAVFGKTRTSPELKKMLLVERSAVNDEFFIDTEGYNNARTLSFNDFENFTEANKYHLTDSLAHSGLRSLQMDSQQKFSPAFKIAFNELTDKDHAWIRASAWIYPLTGSKNEIPLMVMTFSHDDQYYKYRTAGFENRKLEFSPNQWNLLTMDYMTPEVRSARDLLSVYLWFRGTGRVYVDDIQIEVIEPIK